MGYVLRNGRRYYQDEHGNLSLDNLSQEAADRRARQNPNPLFAHTSSPAGASSVFSSGNGTNIALRQSTIPWGAIVIVIIALMMVVAFFYNKNHVSSAEKAISEYMYSASTDNSVYGEHEDVEPLTESEAIVVAENMENTENTELVESEISETRYQYILPDSSERYLDSEDIFHYSKDEIQLIINEIYARHGREFHSQNNIEYFSGLDWYTPISGKTDEDIVKEFNSYEKANVDFLSEYL